METRIPDPTPRTMTETINRAVQSDPQFIKVVVAYKMGNLESAEKYVRVLVEHYFCCAGVHRLHGQILSEIGKHDEAMKAFAAADEWDDNQEGDGLAGRADAARL